MIKIIGGKYKGRKLLQIPKTNIRPTQAVVRKSMFDILGTLDGFDVLDLYSGVGTLGIESISRGARSLVSVEKVPHNYNPFSIMKIACNGSSPQWFWVDFHNRFLTIFHSFLKL